MPVCDVRTVAADVRSQLQRLLGGEVVAGSSTRRLVDMLSAISVYATQNPRINVHLHLTGHDQEGNTFWLPVHEDQQLLDSAAGKVMAMVYRFAESGDAMQYGSDTINPLLNGRTPGGGATPSERGRAETETPSEAVTRTNTVVRADAATSSGATVGRADQGTLGAGATSPRAAFSTPNARSHISTAPVGSRGPRLIQTPGASTPENGTASSSAVVTSGAGGAGAGLLLPGGRDAAVRGTLPNPSSNQEPAAALAGDGGRESSPNDGTYATDAGSRSINEEDDSDDFLMESRYLHSRRRARVLKSPMSTCQPAPVVPSDATVHLVLELLGNNRPKQHVRAVIPLMSAAMRRAGARTVQSMLLTLPWWPRKSAHDVWPMVVVVRNCLLAKIIPRYEVSDGRVTVTLKRWLTKRDDPPVERMANVLLLAEMEPTATEALKSYIRNIKPQPLHEVARTTPRLASLSAMAGLRAVSRVAPTPGELARRRADPRQANTPFDATPHRPNNWVATGSNPPTHHPSRMPPPPVPGHSLLPSGGSSGAVGSGAAAASPASERDSADAFDAQSVTAALLAAQRVIDSCAPARIADRDSESGAGGRQAAPSPMPVRRTQSSRVTLSTAAPASPTTVTPAAASNAPARPAASPPATTTPAATAAAPAPPQPTASPSTASTPAAAGAAHAHPRPEPSPPSAARPSCTPSSRSPAASPPGAERPAGRSYAVSRLSLPAPLPAAQTIRVRTRATRDGSTASPLQSLRSDTPPPTAPGGQLSAHLGSSRRTVSWADAVGFQGSSGPSADSAQTRAAGAAAEAEQLSGGVVSTAERSGTVGAGRFLARDRLGKATRIGVGRKPFGSGRALAQVEAAVSGVAVADASASASSAGVTRSPQQPTLPPVSPSPSLVSSVLEHPVAPPPTFTGTLGMRLRSSAPQRGANKEPSIDADRTAAAALQPPPPVQDSTSSRPSQPATRRSTRASALAAAGSTKRRGVETARSSATTPSTTSASPTPQPPPRAGQQPMTASGTAGSSTAPCSSSNQGAAASARGERTEAADTSGTSTATLRPVAEVPDTGTTKVSGGKRVVPTAAGHEAETELLTKKRRVGVRASAARPPVMPKAKPAVHAAPSMPHMSVNEAPDNSLCHLYVDGGRMVAEGRLLKSKRVLHGRVVDADLIVVCLLSVRAGMHSYPYQNRFPPPSPQRSKMRMADVLQTAIVWSRSLVRVL